MKVFVPLKYPEATCVLRSASRCRLPLRTLLLYSRRPFLQVTSLASQFYVRQNMLFSNYALSPSLDTHLLSFSASGLGHGLAHSAMFFLALLTPTLGAATYYLEGCPEVPFFLAAGMRSSWMALISVASCCVLRVCAQEVSLTFSK